MEREDTSGSLSKSPKWTGRRNCQFFECATVGRNGKISETEILPAAFSWKDSGSVRYSKSGGRRRLVLCEDRRKDLRVCVREVHRKDLGFLYKGKRDTLRI